MRKDQHIHPAVIVKITDRQAAAHPLHRPGACPIGAIGQVAVGTADQELGGHLEWVIRPQVVDMAVG